MKNFLRSSEFRLIAVCLLCMTLATVACVKTAQEIKSTGKQIESLKAGLPTGVTELTPNADGTTTIKFIVMKDEAGNKYKDGSATFSTGTKFSADGGITIPDGGWCEIDGCRAGSLCPNICKFKTSN